MSNHHKVNYLEIPVNDLTKTKTFFLTLLVGTLKIMALNTAAFWTLALMVVSIYHQLTLTLKKVVR